MPDDLEGIVEQVKNMLGGENGTEVLANIASMFSQNSHTDEKEQEENKSKSDGEDLSSLLGGMDIQKIAKLASAYQGIKGKKDDPRTQLLIAIKPYLSEKRAEKLDGAIKIVEFTKLGSVAKELNLF